MSKLFDRHLDDLRSSGLSDVTIRDAGVYSAEECQPIVKWPRKLGPGLVFPYPGCNGYCRVKPDTPPKGRDKKPAKYLTPVDGAVHAYFPPGFDEKANDIIITEGEKKALAAMQVGFNCFALAGVWCFKDKECELLPELLVLDWNDKKVSLVFDSDAEENKIVEKAEAKLKERLTEQGAEVVIVRLPELTPGEKTGLDDYLVCEGKDKLSALIRNTWKQNEHPPIQILSADDILTTDWPEPVWAVPDILPTGLSILAGKPKVGKSWLGLQLTYSVAAGGKMFDRKVDPGPVFYIALEDSPARLKKRMARQNWPKGLPVDFLTLGDFSSIGDLRNGGGERLARQIEKKRYRLVVIDTLSRSVAGDQNDVEKMTQALTPIQEIAHDKNCIVTMIDHHHKLSSADAITDILGSTAKGAMADCVWGLYRERGKAGAKLAITGRDVEEQILALKVDWELGCWQCEGDADELQMIERHNEIIAYLESIGKAGVIEISKAVGRDKGNVFKDLQDLLNAGQVIKKGKGKGQVKYEFKNSQKDELVL